MYAMILAAGRGERMRPLTDHTPKPLLKVGGKSLIVWHIEKLAAAGFKHIVINHAYLGAQIESTLGNGDAWGVSINYSPETTALETAGGIANAMHLLGNDAFVVVNGDTYTDMDFTRFKTQAERLVKEKQLAHLWMVTNPPQHVEGDFSLNDGLLSSDGVQKLTFSGIGLYQPSLFWHVEKGPPAKLAPILRAAMLNKQVSGTHFKGEWHDIGTPARLTALDEKLRNI